MWYGPFGVGIGFSNFQPSTVVSHAFVAPGSALAISVWVIKPVRAAGGLATRRGAALFDFEDFFFVAMEFTSLLFVRPGMAGSDLRAGPFRRGLDPAGVAC